MKKTYSLMLVSVMAFVPVTRAVDRIVTTTAGTGAGSLTAAIGALADGDTIKFNIAGAGVKYIATPAGGYPFITNNNITFDGYSQLGASPNTQGIHQPNNAQIKIVLDSRNGAGRPMGGPEGTTTLTDTSVWGEVTDSGWGDTEVAILPLYRGTNILIKGLGFLASHGSSEPAGGTMKCICIATDTKSALATEVFAGSGSGWQVSGCWFGVDPATGQAYIDLNASTEDTTMALATYGCKQAGAANTVYAVNGTIGVAKNSTNPRAEFNVIVAGYGCDLQGRGHRYSGNFANVLPDGMHNVDWFQVDGGAQEGDGDFECGGNGVANLTIGTDSDGVNDEEEGNIFGGSLSRGWVNVHMYSGPRTNIVFAGNYVGVAIDGVTRFTNSSRLIRFNTSTATGRVGSDFDGVSDSLEANLIFNNFPFDTAYPIPESETPNTPVLVLDPGARVSLRGNKTVGNNLIPYNYANLGASLASFTNYAAPFMDVNSANGIIPILATTNIFPRLTGAFAPGIAPYTTVVLDVYELDPEGWANGKRFLAQELTDNATFTNGFAQGMKYLGSFTVPNTGNFDINLPAYAGVVTVTANYSADPAGTKNGRVHTSNFSNPGYIAPGAIASVGLTNIVPDVLVWYNQTGGYVTNGPINNLADQAANLANWEPNISVLGDSTFLIEANTFANDGSLLNQNNAVTLQPAAGGAAKVSYAFSTDAGVPFKGQLNLSRQNGNPGRVAGDKRVGAVNYITAAETSLGQLPEFKSDSRWNNNPIYTIDRRYVASQLFSLNTTTLVPTPLAKAWDFVYGSFVTTDEPVNTPEVSRTGGTVAGLDNGNFVVVLHDKTGYSSAGVNNVTTFAIVTPSGATVRTNTFVDPRDIWDNVAAFKGGFVVRCHDTLYFYNNAGDLQGSSLQAASGLTFGTGRNDASRVASDIRSYYVYLAGRSPEASENNPGEAVWVAIWDSRTRAFVASAQVSDGSPENSRNNRVNLAVDALDRFCVAYANKADIVNFPNANWQVAARVMAFDGAKISYLTHSFYPFVNSDPTGEATLLTEKPSVAMTTRQICIAANGIVNSQNNPAGGGNTAAQTTFYTVISHPAPVSSTGPSITATRSGNNLTISWAASAGSFTLQSTPTVSPTAWTNVTPQPPIVPAGGQNTMTVVIGSGNTFFRLSN
jgi:hypothetical protein